MSVQLMHDFCFCGLDKLVSRYQPTIECSIIYKKFSINLKIWWTTNASVTAAWPSKDIRLGTPEGRRCTSAEATLGIDSLAYKNKVVKVINQIRKRQETWYATCQLSQIVSCTVVPFLPLWDECLDEYKSSDDATSCFDCDRKMNLQNKSNEEIDTENCRHQPPSNKI